MMRRFAWIAFTPVLGLGFCAAGPPPAAAPASPGPVVGRPAPPFDLTTVDGKHVRLADYRGRVLVVNVWGSWCPPCRLETPDLVDEAERDARSVAFLGVDTTEPASVVRAFAAAKGIPYPQVATTSTSAFARDYDIRAYPTTLVIDANGVLRAQHADNILPRAQLRAYIGAAQQGRSAPLVSAFQQQLDTLLQPAQYPFSGDAAAVRENVHRAVAAIDKADGLLDDAMDDPARDHDLLATKAEEETLRAAAIAAFAPLATSDGDKALLARLRGDEAAQLGAWHDADAAYAQALAIDPSDVSALGGAAYAASQLGDAKRVVMLNQQIAALGPSAPAFVALGRAQAKAGDLPGAEASFAHAEQLAVAEPARLAWTDLYFGRVETAAGNARKAHDAFARAGAAALRIPKTDPRQTWYIEEAQEGTVALGVARASAPALSLAPWTGPDLPGSLASTLKYRLVVTGAPGANVALAASGLPRHWIGSFCSDRVCAPFRTSVALPAAGVKIVEFQVVPYGAATAPVTVRVDASTGGRRVASVTTAVHV